MNYEELEEKIGYSFNDKKILEEALTHSSYPYLGIQISYDRLELLGDAIVGLIISEALYKRFPNEPEGDLSKRKAALVCGHTLASISRDLSLGKFIKMGTGFKNSNGQDSDSILEDVFESIAAAIYLDGGFEKAKDFIICYLEPIIDKYVAPPQDPKTKLQEWLQSRGHPIPKYKTINQVGPSHSPIFTTEVSVKGFEPATSQGNSKKEAQRGAAINLYNQIIKNNGK